MTSLIVRAALWLAGCVFTVLSTGLAVLKGVDWFFGLSTMPDNAEATQSLAGEGLRWVLRQGPSTTLIVMIAALLALGLLLMAWAVRRTQPPAVPQTEAPGQTGIAQSTPGIPFATPIGQGVVRSAPTSPQLPAPSASGPDASALPIERAAASRFPRGLYVGEVNVDVSHLEREFYIEIHIRGFNATGEKINMNRLSGSIISAEMIDEILCNNGKLPSPHVNQHSSLNENIKNFSEFVASLHQRFESGLAKDTMRQLFSGGDVSLLFDEWKLIASIAERADRIAFVPVGDEISLRKSGDAIIAYKIY